jgi:hypothetical protein
MSPTNRQFALALEALAELKTDAPAIPPQPIPTAPNLDRVLAEFGPLPREALFLGVASDGLPVLLNLRDPLPGPILITGDAGSGKTAFLTTIAESVKRTHGADEVQVGVITHHTEEWQGLKGSPQLAGLFSPRHAGAQEMILSLASWAHSNRDNRSRFVLLLIDDLETAAQMDFETVQHLRWLLLRGSSHGVWTFVTIEAGKYGGVIAWLPSFRTRLFGRIAEERTAAALGADTASGVGRLEAGVKFSLRENGDWLQFWLPNCTSPDNLIHRGEAPDSPH